MNKNNRTCVICGKEYRFCYSCNTKNKPTWLASFCDKNCREIYHICVDFDAGKLSKEDAMGRLSKCDLSDFNNYTASTKEIIKRIQKKNINLSQSTHKQKKQR